MFSRRDLFVSPLATTILLLAVTAATMSVGCQRKERLVDIKTPAGDVQVDRDKNNGDVEVNVHDN